MVGDNYNETSQVTWTQLVASLTAVVALLGGGTMYAIGKADNALAAAMAARPDPFTGTMGREMENRIMQAIETKAALTVAQHNTDQASTNYRLEFLERGHNRNEIREEDCVKFRSEIYRRLERLEHEYTERNEL